MGGEGELNSVLLGLYISSTVPLCTRGQELCESGGGRPRLPVPNSPHGICGRKATLQEVLTHAKGSVVHVKVLWIMETPE